MSELPEGWAEARLEDVISDGPTNGYSPKSGSDANGTKSLKLSATTTGRFLLNEKTIKPLYEDVDVSSKYWLTAGDLLLQRANSLDYLGVAAIFPGPDKSFVYPDLMMRVRGSESCHTSYLWRHLNSDSTRSYFRDNATGTAGNMPKINGKVVKATPIKLPPLNEQKRIVAKIDALTEKSREAREALAEVPRLERLAVGYFSSGWGPQLLGEHIEARDELAGEEWRSFPALSLSNSGDLSPRTEKIGEKSAHKCKVLRNSDVVFNPIRLSIGSIAFYDGKAPVIVSPEYQVLRCKGTLSARFLVRFFRSAYGKSYLETESKGSVRYRVYFKTLAKLQVPIAPPEKQQVAEALFASIERVQAISSELEHELATLDASILAKAFRGELVPQDPSDEPASVLLERIRAEREAGGAKKSKAKKKRGTE